MPYGTSTRYFDPKRSSYALKFIPFAYVFCKVESKETAALAHTTLTTCAEKLLGIKVNVLIAGFDASNAFRGGFQAPIHFTDWAHASRKLLAEQGPNKLKDGTAGLTRTLSEEADLQAGERVAGRRQETGEEVNPLQTGHAGPCWA